MNILFTVEGIGHELQVRELDDLPALGRSILASLVETCAAGDCDSDLEARIFDGMLLALVEGTDLELGEVVGESRDGG